MTVDRFKIMTINKIIFLKIISVAIICQFWCLTSEFMTGMVFNFRDLHQSDNAV